MAYVYICDACKNGDHKHCEESKDLPTEGEMLGGGFCVCDHEDVYEEPGEVWARHRMLTEGG